MNQRAWLIIVVLAAGLLGWLALGVWIPSGIERLYLVLPPVLIGAALVVAKDWRQWLRTEGRFLVAYFVLVVALSLSGGYLFYGRITGADSLSMMSRYSRELLLAGYFVLALVLILLPAYRLLRRGIERVEEKWRGPLDKHAPLPPGRALVRQVVPTLLFLPLVVPYLLCVSFIHRAKIPNHDPAVLFGSRSCEEVDFQTRDGYTLRGWYLPAAYGPTERTLLLCHGIGANRSDLVGFVQVGDALRANMLFFDFRGHGESEGHTVSIGHHEKQDVLAAIEFLRRERPNACRELFGLGVSMGSGALVRAAAEIEPPLDGLVLDSGFASARELTDHVLAQYPRAVRPYLTSVGLPLASLHAGCRMDALRPAEQIANLRAPVLIVHSGEDEVIPADHARRLFAKAAEPKRLWITERGGHMSAFALQPSEYLRRVAELESTCRHAE